MLWVLFVLMVTDVHSNLQEVWLKLASPSLAQLTSQAGWLILFSHPFGGTLVGFICMKKVFESLLRFKLFDSP